MACVLTFITLSVNVGMIISDVATVTKPATLEDGSSIHTYQMHELCGQIINMKWESIHTAEVHFEASPRGNLSVSKYDPSKDNAYTNTEPCDLVIESWDFQNRIMIYFKELHIEGECSETLIELLDGPTITSPMLTGMPRFICTNQTEKILFSTFTTSYKHLTVRFHGKRLHTGNTRFTFMIVSFHEGPCFKSYEHECTNGICIMDDLACNGHNPCGDNSDCISESPTEVAVEDDNVLLAAMIALSVVLVCVVVGIIIFCRCYVRRRKTRRQQHYLSSNLHTDDAENNTTNELQRTVSQIEADRSFAPPSYTSVPLEREHTHSDVTKPEEDETITPSDSCAEPGSKNPPAYECVMLHKDLFHLSDLNIKGSCSSVIEEI